jgi:hypothetical protein
VQQRCGSSMTSRMLIAAVLAVVAAPAAGQLKHEQALAHIKTKGYITATELRAHLAEEHREHFEYHRQKILEAVTELEKELPLFDTDGDGLVSPDECKMQSYKRKQMHVIDTGIGPGMLMYANDENFAAADTNGDGKLSMDEMMEHHREKIDEDTLIGWSALDLMRVADKDEDGKVTDKEAEGVMGAFKHHLHHDADL